jgi:hypothetical protein
MKKVKKFRKKGKTYDKEFSEKLLEFGKKKKPRLKPDNLPRKGNNKFFLEEE